MNARDRILENNNTCAVVITFNPDRGVIENLKSLSLQFNEVIVIDNHSSSNITEWLKNELYNEPKINIFYNKKNVGIAAALNQGLDISIEKNYDWAATFDQDSKITDGYMEAMFQAYESCNDKQNVAVIAPQYFDELKGIMHSFSRHKNNRSNKDCRKTLFEEVKVTMTSGNIVKTRIFREVGGCDERLFIDYVDNELCLKYRLNAYKIIESTKSILIHAPGNPTIHNLLGLKLSCPNHNAIRRYYKYRNRVLVYKKYLLFDPAWVVQDCLYFVTEICKIILFESQKQEKLLKILIGVVHGMKGKTGEYQ